VTARKLLSDRVLALTVVAAALTLSSCAIVGMQNGPLAWNQAMPAGVYARDMLEEIYASRKPQNFEQIDVSDIVLKYTPFGTEKAMIVNAFKVLRTTKILEDSLGKLVMRDNKGQAMLHPDARAIVMTFSFDTSGKLTKVDAVHLKSQ
jgi:Family of unknown function (DUF6393)